LTRLDHVPGMAQLSPSSVRGRDERLGPFPVVDLVGQGRRVREERRPRCERCGADRVIDDGANALLDPLPFEDEDHEVVAKVDRVSCQAKVGWIEGRTVGNQLARPRVRSLPQLQGDDEPLHGSIIGFRQRRRVMCGRPTRPALPRTRSLLTEEASRPGAGRSFDQRPVRRRNDAPGLPERNQHRCAGRLAL